jgi:hypothetical protein
MLRTKQYKDPSALKIASFRTKEGVWAEFCDKAESVNLTATDVLKMAMAEFIDGRYVPNVGKLLVRHDNRNDDVLTKDEINKLIDAAIGRASLPDDEHTDNVLTNVDVEKSIDAALEIALEPLAERLNELETYTRSHFAAVRDEFESLSSRVDSATAKPDRTEQKLAAAKLSVDRESEPDNIKTWGEFFKMVGIEALTAVEAQKKQNIDIRTRQIEMGLQAAREQGLGEWVAKRGGRSFVRVTPP